MGEKAIPKKWREVSLFDWSFKRRDNEKKIFHGKTLFIFDKKQKSIEDVGFGTFHEMEIGGLLFF